MIRSLAAALLVLLLPAAHAQQVLSGPAPAPTELDATLAELDDIEALTQLAARYRAERELRSEAAVWKRLSALRPHRGHYKYEMAAAYAGLDEKSQTYNALLELQGQGYAFAPETDRRFDPVATTEAWEYIVQNLEANRKPFGEGQVAHTLPAEDLLIESLAWDPSRKRLLVGSAREGKVFVLGDGDRLQPLVAADADNGLWAVMDLVVDAERGVLWVASTAVPHFRNYDAERDLGRAGVFKFDLETGKFLKRFLSPSVLGQSFFMSNLALAPDGTVFAADGVNNAVYMVRDDQLKRLFHAPVLGSVRGLSVSGDGRVLYFADHERGVFGFDLAAGKPFEVAVPKTLALGGIDGLLWWQNHLLVIQGGMQPARVMRLALAPDGRSFTGVRPLAANQPAFGLPTLGTLAGDSLYLIANSQKQQYDRFGLPRNRKALEGVRVYRLDVDL